MKKIGVLLILFLVLAAASVSLVSAQDVDLSNLSQEQIGLMVLLLQQIEQGGMEAPAPTVTPTPTSTPLPASDGNPFEGYSEEQIQQLLMLLQQMQQTPTAVPTPTPRPLPDMSQFEGYDNEQLQTLITMLQQMQRENGQGGSDLTEETPAAPVTPSDPVTETGANAVYVNKKLLTEALPSSMFVRPTKEPKPSRDDPAVTQDVPLYKDVTKDFEEIEDAGNSCTWHLVDGKWFYICDSIG